MLYEELRKEEIKQFNIAVEKAHETLIKMVKVYGLVFYRIDDVYALKNEELKQQIITEAIETILKG